MLVFNIQMIRRPCMHKITDAVAFAASLPTGKATWCRGGRIPFRRIILAFIRHKTGKKFPQRSWFYADWTPFWQSSVRPTGKVHSIRQLGIEELHFWRSVAWIHKCIVGPIAVEYLRVCHLCYHQWQACECGCVRATTHVRRWFEPVRITMRCQ